MLALNLKTFNCLLHNCRHHPWVTVNVRLWKSACRLIITWTGAVSKEQWFICPFYPEQPVRIQTDLFSCVNQWVYFVPRIYPLNRSTLTRQSVQLSRWRSELQQLNSTFQWISFDKQAICSQHGSFKASKWIFPTPSNEFEVESCTLTIRTKLLVFVDRVRPCHTLPTVIKRYKKAHSQLTHSLHKT